MSASQEQLQIPTFGPLSSLSEEHDLYGETQYLSYGSDRHLRKAFRIPIELLHFNIENGRYATKFKLLEASNPQVVIDPRLPEWRDEILRMLDGTWENPATGDNTRTDQTHFENLVDDIEQRGQERTGIVLEDGGVMSGNRRLAALMTLANRHPDAVKYRLFYAFIVPVEGVSPADRWRLEMSAQMGQGRLLREYAPVERLIKIREGVELLRESPQNLTREAAVMVIANDFGTEPKSINAELDVIKHIDAYLDAIGQPQQYYLANSLTEVFTEMEPLEQAMDANEMDWDDRARLRRAVYHIIRNNQADFHLIRDIRGAVGPIRRRADARPVPKAIETLTTDAPDADVLDSESEASTEGHAATMVERFRAEYQAGRPGPILAKAQRGEANLRAVKEALELDNSASWQIATQLSDALESARDHASASIDLIQKASG